MQLSTGSHCVINLKAHLIFVVAYRRKVISSTILERLKEIFADLCQRDQVRFLECSGEEDHVHLLISYPPTICLSNLVRKLKIESSLKIRQEFFNQIRRMLWGKRFWTKSYCVISVGDGATTAIIERYIKNQRPNWHSAGRYPSPRLRTGNSVEFVKRKIVFHGSQIIQYSLSESPLTFWTQGRFIFNFVRQLALSRQLIDLISENKYSIAAILTMHSKKTLF